jgi:cobalt-zinc-cadmium efflux system outer membrane protein
MVGFSLGILTASAHGTPTPASLSLIEAQQLAVENNADFRITQTQVAAALGQLRSAREFPNPVAGFSVSKINTDGRGNATPAGNGFYSRSYDSIASLSQLIELGKRGPRQNSAESGLRLAEAQRDNARRLLLQAVGQAYLAAIELREEERVLTESAISLRKEAGIAASRFRAGEIAATDQAQIEMTASQLDLQRAAARANARQAIIVLETLLNYPAPHGLTQLVDSLDRLPSVAIANDIAVGTRPDLVAAEAGVVKSEADLKLARRGNLPDLTLSVMVEHQPPDQPNTVGVGISFPFPLWNRNKGNILAARAARDQSAAQLDKIRVQASADVASARVAFDEARERAETYRRDLQPKSASIVKTVAYAYSKGGASLSEMLAAQRTDNDLRLAAARAEADAATTALSLAAALNTLEFAPPASAVKP